MYSSIKGNKAGVEAGIYQSEPIWLDKFLSFSYLSFYIIIVNILAHNDQA